MKIGPDKPENSGKQSKGKGKGAAKSAQESVDLKTSDPKADPSMLRLSELAAKTRRELVDKAGLQSSLKDKLLISRNRTAEIRQRIQAGYYGRPEVVRSIVDRLAEYIEP